MEKGGVLFSPRAGGSGGGGKVAGAGKEVVGKSVDGQEMKAQGLPATKMFIDSCKMMRIMKGSGAIGLELAGCSTTNGEMDHLYLKLLGSAINKS